MESSQTYQQNSCLSSSPEPGWCCECCRRRTYYCWACLQMWLAHTWCSCPSPSCLGFWILLGCTRLQSHAWSEKKAGGRKTHPRLEGGGNKRVHNALNVTYWGAKVVSYFMCKSDMWDFWRYMGGIILYSDYTSVKGLPFSIRVQLAFFTDSPRAPWNRETHRKRSSARHLLGFFRSKSTRMEFYKLVK